MNKKLFILLLACLVLSIRLPASAKDSDNSFPLRKIDQKKVDKLTSGELPRSNWEEFNFRLYDEEEAIFSDYIHVIWAGNYDEFQVIVYDQEFKPVFEVFHPRFVRYACGGVGCQYWISNIPKEITESGPFYLQVEGISFTLNTTRYSRVLGFERKAIQ